jgi:drug/metabolite transporter (DMT)-like permease
VSISIAIVLTLIASTCMNVALVLQKKAATEPGWRLERCYRSPLWCTGLAMLAGGYGLFILANSFRAAPISLLQPISAFGLLVVALLAVVYLQERFGPLEWVGVLLLVTGVVLLGVSAEESSRQTAAVDLPRLLLYLSGLGTMGVVAVLLLKLSRAWLSEELLYGMLAGVLLGCGYLNTRVLTLAWQEARPGPFWLALVLMGLGLLVGLAVLQKGFQNGRALIVTAVNLVVNQVMVVVGGILCLGESFPQEGRRLSARVSGLITILAGTLILARFSSGGATGTMTPTQPAETEQAPNLGPSPDDL